MFSNLHACAELAKTAYTEKREKSSLRGDGRWRHHISPNGDALRAAFSQNGPPISQLLLRNLIALCVLSCFSSTQPSMVFGEPQKMILTVLDARFIKYPPEPRLKVWKIGKLENWQHRGWDHGSMCQGAKAGARRAGVLFYFCPPLTPS